MVYIGELSLHDVVDVKSEDTKKCDVVWTTITVTDCNGNEFHINLFYKAKKE